MPEENQNQNTDHGDIVGYEARWDYEEEVPADSIDDDDEVVENG